MEKDSVRKEAKELSNELLRIAGLASRRKLTREQRNAYMRLFRMAGLALLDASETGLSGHLSLAKTIMTTCEVSLLSEEEGEGSRIEVPKLSEISISQSDRVKILQRLGSEEKQPIWVKYWREIVIGILIMLIVALITRIMNLL